MSTAIKSDNYNADTKVFTIVFNYAPDTAYDYLNVSQGDAYDYATAESKGKFVNTVIKPKYAVEKRTIA